MAFWQGAGAALDSTGPAGWLLPFNHMMEQASKQSSTSFENQGGGMRCVLDGSPKGKMM